MSFILQLYNQSLKLNSFFEFNVVLLSSLIIFYLIFNDTKKHFNKISKQTWIYLILISISAFLLRFFYTPHIIIRDHLHGFDSMGAAFMGIIDLPSATYTYFIYLFKHYFKLPELAFNINILFGSLSVVAFFFLLYLLFKKEQIAVFGTLLFSMLPIHIKYSSSDVAIITGIFFSIMTLIFMFIFFKSENYWCLVLSVLMLFFATSSRYEMSFFPLIYFIIFMLEDNKIKKYFKNKKLYFIAILFLFLILRRILNLTINLIIRPLMYHEKSRFNVNNFFGAIYKIFNINVNTFLNLEITPFLFILFFLFGMIILFFKNKKRSLWLLLWIVLTLNFYTPSNINVNYIFKHARFNLQSLLPYLILASFGLYKLIYWINFIINKLSIRNKTYRNITSNKNINQFFIFVFFVILLMSFPITYFGFIKDSHYNPQNEYYFIKEIIEEIPYNSQVWLYLPPAGDISKMFEFSKKNISVYRINKLTNNSILFEKYALKNKTKNRLFYYYGLECYRGFSPENVNKTKCDEIYKYFNNLSIFKQIVLKNKPFNQHDEFVTEDVLNFTLYELK